MIPVRQIVLDSLKPHGNHETQVYPINFDTQSYPTLLDGTTVDIVKGDPGSRAPEWSNVLVNKDIRIIGSKEVRISFWKCPTS